MGVWEAGLVGDAEGSVAWPGGRTLASGVLSLGPGLSKDLEHVVRTVGTTVCLGLSIRHQRGSEPGFSERLPPPTRPPPTTYAPQRCDSTEVVRAGREQGGQAGSRAGRQGAGRASSRGGFPGEGPEEVVWAEIRGGGGGVGLRMLCVRVELSMGPSAWSTDSEGQLRRANTVSCGLGRGRADCYPFPTWAKSPVQQVMRHLESRSMCFVAGRHRGPTCGLFSL